jgi:hypothetical protein
MYNVCISLQNIPQKLVVTRNLYFHTSVHGVGDIRHMEIHTAEALVLRSSPYEFEIELKLNYVALVRKRTIPTERPPLVGEVSANFLRIQGVAWSAQRILPAVNSVFLTEAATFSFK